MRFTSSFSRPALFLALVLPALMAVLQVAHSQAPAQTPLLNKSGGGVDPNVMLNIDDSGSMLFQHMPESSVVVGSFTVAHPIGSNSVRMHPSDNATLAAFFVGTIAAQQTSTNWRQKMLRSPDTNTIYYNPEIRYSPWAVSTFPLPAATATNPAGRMANSPVAAAFRDPNSPVAGGVIDLTTVSASINDTWCFRNTSSGCNNNNAAFDPGLYYRLKKNASGQYLDPANEANYDRYTINNIGAAAYSAYPVKSAARTDCAGATCTQAEERQNFANWFSYYRTRNLMTRGALMEAFATVGNTFRVGFGRINKGTASVDGVNTKVIESNTATYGGGGVRAFDQTRKNQLFTWLRDLPANGGTPLPAALASVGDYFKRTDDKGPWTDNPGQTGNTVANNKTCRRSYQIMATDGYWNGTPPTVGNVDATAGSPITQGANTYTYVPSPLYADGASDTLADVAMKYWKNDLQPATANEAQPTGDNPSFWQNVTVFTVGLGVKGSLDPDKDLPALAAGTKVWPAPSNSVSLAANIDDLWHAAVNSRGEYYSAKDPAELASAIKGALAGAQGGSGATAGVATASTVLESTNRKYVPAYKAGEWSGDISALPLDTSGQATTAVWKAASKMPAWNSRKIFTWDATPTASPTTPAGVTFTWAAMSATNKAAMSVSSTVPSSYTSTFVNFLYGDHSNEGVANPFRTRVDSAGAPFILGDFVNSNPVLVKNSFDGGYGGLGLGGATGYQTFVAAKGAREATLFVGGNDGMLHAFRDSKGTTPSTDGQEVFAYVPRAVYGNLYKLADKTYGTGTLEHQYFVDGPQRESDAFVKGPGTTIGTLAPSASWRNYLTGSLGAGGKAVYAIDVTDAPNLKASSIRWEISNTTAGASNLGYVLAPIEVGVLQDGKWVAIFGNGFASALGYATLFVVDLETGAVTTLDVETSGLNGLGGVAVARNASGQITNLYAGDLKGNLWKFDYNASATSKFEVSGASAIFTAYNASSVPQPITQAPAIFKHSQGGNMLVFGTGKLFETTDPAVTTTQSIYGVWDKPLDSIPRPLSRSLLAPRTLSSATTSGFYTLSGTATTASQRGWYIDLSPLTTGGRVIFPAQPVTEDLVLVTAVEPATSAAVCTSADGIGINLIFAAEDGIQVNYHLFDTDGNNKYTVDDEFVAGYKTKAQGISAIVKGFGFTGTGKGTDSAGNCLATNTVSAQDAYGNTNVCVQKLSSASPVKPFNRTQRRIINPPIR